MVFQRNWRKHTITATRNGTTLTDIHKVKGRIITTYCTINLVRFELILAIILKRLPLNKNALTVHGSSALINPKAYLFLGRSTSGKTTITRLLSKKYKTLADDLLYYGKVNSEFNFYQVPLSKKISIKRELLPY